MSLQFYEGAPASTGARPCTRERRTLVTGLIDPLVIELAPKVPTRSRRSPGLLGEPLEVCSKIMQRYLRGITPETSSNFSERCAWLKLCTCLFIRPCKWIEFLFSLVTQRAPFFALACNKPLARLMRNRRVVHSRALCVAVVLGGLYDPRAGE